MNFFIMNNTFIFGFDCTCNYIEKNESMHFEISIKYNAKLIYYCDNTLVEILQNTINITHYLNVYALNILYKTFINVWTIL